jgi:hypothetical protein
MTKVLGFVVFIAALGMTPHGGGQGPLHVSVWGQDHCGTGLDANGEGSQQVAYVAEALVWRAEGAVPARELWIVAVNPLREPQTLQVRTLGFVSTPKTYLVPVDGRLQVNVGEDFIPPHVSASFGLELVWEKHGALDVIGWDAGYTLPVHPQITLTCREAWRHPYGG